MYHGNCFIDISVEVTTQWSTGLQYFASLVNIHRPKRFTEEGGTEGVGWFAIQYDSIVVL